MVQLKSTHRNWENTVEVLNAHLAANRERLTEAQNFVEESSARASALLKKAWDKSRQTNERVLTEGAAFTTVPTPTRGDPPSRAPSRPRTPSKSVSSGQRVSQQPIEISSGEDRHIQEDVIMKSSAVQEPSSSVAASPSTTRGRRPRSASMSTGRTPSRRGKQSKTTRTQSKRL